MKQYKYFLIVAIFMTTMLVSCKSNEEKAAETIKEELFQTLYNFDSYQPIETIVTKAKEEVINDSNCWNKAALFSYAFEKVSLNLELAKTYRDMVKEWGYDPSYAKEDKEKYTSVAEKYNSAARICNAKVEEILEIKSGFNSNNIVGWNVEHRFRCKTKGGSSTIAHHRYVISKDFKTIILCEDLDSDEDKKIRNVLEHVIDDWNSLPALEEDL